MKKNAFVLMIGLVLLAGAVFANEEKAPKAKKEAERPRPQKMDRDAPRPDYKNRENTGNRWNADRGPKGNRDYRGPRDFQGEGKKDFRGPKGFPGPMMPFGMKDGKIEIKKVVQWLEKMDSDKDGFVSQEERMEFHAKMIEKFKKAGEKRGEFKGRAPKDGAKKEFRGPAAQDCPKDCPKSECKKGPAPKKDAPKKMKKEGPKKEASKE